MKNIYRLSLCASAILLTACVNQNTIAEKKITPVTNPCQKITGLINAYHTNFDAIKGKQVNARSSSIWQAKYNLIGENCQVWSWGGKQSTYSCRVVTQDEATAKQYYKNAKEKTSQCLQNIDENWQVQESPRKRDTGLKTEFTNKNSDVTLSTHIVPSKNAFKSQWTVFYYVGNSSLEQKHVKDSSNP